MPTMPMASGSMEMIAEIDIWRSARQIIGREGEDAPLEAAMRADAMLKAGDIEGAGGRITAAVETLLQDRPDGVMH